MINLVSVLSFHPNNAILQTCNKIVSYLDIKASYSWSIPGPLEHSPTDLNVLVIISTSRFNYISAVEFLRAQSWNHYCLLFI